MMHASLSAPDSASGRIPVTLLTGFLGSGKTTLLNALVRQPAMSQALVLINEFGEIGLDHDLFAASSDGEQIELSNGCICCTIRTDLARALRDAVWRFSREGERRFDRLIIETTGLADPAPIVRTLLGEPRVARHYRLDGIVTTLDSAHAAATLERFEEARRQASMADLLLLTKCDQAGAAEVARLEQQLATLNPGARRLRVTHGAIDAATLTDLSPQSLSERGGDIAGWLEAPEHSPGLSGAKGFAFSPAGSSAPAAPLAPAVAEPVHHDERIRTHSFTFATPIRAQRLESWLSIIGMLMGDNMLRFKGILDIDGRTRPVAIHGVQHLIYPPIELPRWPGDERVSRLVFITCDIERQHLADSLDAFLFS